MYRVPAGLERVVLRRLAKEQDDGHKTDDALPSTIYCFHSLGVGCEQDAKSLSASNRQRSIRTRRIGSDLCPAPPGPVSGGATGHVPSTV